MHLRGQVESGSNQDVVAGVVLFMSDAKRLDNVVLRPSGPGQGRAEGDQRPGADQHQRCHESHGRRKPPAADHMSRFHPTFTSLAVSRGQPLAPPACPRPVAPPTATHCLTTTGK